MNASDRNITCHVCAEPALESISGYEGFRQVTSDCKPWPSGGALFGCAACGCIQKSSDGVWRAVTDKIYQAYSIYHQSRGAEQPVFEQVAGGAEPRSARLLECLRSSVRLPEAGRLLDVGCGNGALLQSFHAVAPRWSLAGTELDEKHRSIIESIGGVAALYTGALEEIPGTFDLITMVHVLEHIAEPGEFLAGLWNRLEIGGLLVVQVPDYAQNPFDLLIADHCSHFSAVTLTKLIQSAGYEVVTITTDWIPKELTLVARKTGLSPTSTANGGRSFSFECVIERLLWLRSVVASAREISANGGFGLFGTSIAATWLFSECEGAVTFFVDEDPNRAGRSYMDRPVYHPNDVPSDSHVFMALPPRVAASVRRRVARVDVTYHLPPALERAQRAPSQNEAREGTGVQ